MPPAHDSAQALQTSLPLVGAKDVRKSYDRQEVLRGVSLAVEPGEMVALVGRSGSGKSTLLHIIGGLDRDYQGTVICCGKDLSRLSDRELSLFRNQEIGLVFQAFHLLDHLSCVENVMLPDAFAREPLSRGEALSRATLALDRVDLAGRASALPVHLSGGQKQRVAIARALFYRPRLLLCDEPTGNLDSHTGQQIIELFQTLHKDGLTLILVTHEERISQVAQRVVRLADGKIES